MIPLFLGLTAANLLLLSGVFTLGLWVPQSRFAEDVAILGLDVYVLHILAAIAAGLMVVFVHVTVYTYFMATTKWLGAATDKMNFDPSRFLGPAEQNKRQAFFIVMTAIIVTMLTMFAGAAADTITGWPAMIHFVAGITTLAINLLCALAEYRAIRYQGQLMDAALAIINDSQETQPAAVAHVAAATSRAESTANAT